jgi:hypothetical protein
MSKPRHVAGLFATALGVAALTACGTVRAPVHALVDTAPTPATAPAHPASMRATSVKVDEVHVVGGDVPNASEVAETMVPQFRECQMRWAPSARGDIAVSAKVGPGGEVRMATPTSDDLSGMLVSCVGSQVSRGQFATPSGDDPVVVIHLHFVSL